MNMGRLVWLHHYLIHDRCRKPYEVNRTYASLHFFV